MIVKRILTGVGLFLLLGSSAWADALDGEWCNKNHGKLTIDGPSIITPGGRQVTGRYSRHRFDYVAPADDWQAGKTIVILQSSETMMTLKAGDGPAEQWAPCLFSS